jgi:two-component system response regulator FlrC
MEAMRQLDGRDADGQLPIAADPVSRQLLELATRVAGSDAAVMLTGESGVGKEVYARFLHRASARCAGPFVALNCAAIPENMLEAMLFGYERGAFTGATEARPGKFEQAHGGTLLLDEITEMEIGLQAKLLRVLQEREVERIGGRRVIRFNVRVISTSNRDLRGAVAEGRLREDLYYRLHVFPLHVPALRERPGDLLPLARHLLERHAGARGLLRLSACAEARLLAHSWPGNVRELENVMQRALVLCNGTIVDAAALHIEDQWQGVGASRDAAPAAALGAAPGPANGEATTGLGEEVRVHEEQLILNALRVEQGSRKEAAARLGISPRTLRYKLARMRELGLAIP